MRARSSWPRGRRAAGRQRAAKRIAVVEPGIGHDDRAGNVRPRGRGAPGPRVVARGAAAPEAHAGIGPRRRRRRRSGSLPQHGVHPARRASWRPTMPQIAVIASGRRRRPAHGQRAGASGGGRIARRRSAGECLDGVHRANMCCGIDRRFQGVSALAADDGTAARSWLHETEAAPDDTGSIAVRKRSYRRRPATTTGNDHRQRPPVMTTGRDVADGNEESRPCASSTLPVPPDPRTTTASRRSGVLDPRRGAGARPDEEMHRAARTAPDGQDGGSRMSRPLLDYRAYGLWVRSPIALPFIRIPVPRPVHRT